eukprot:g20915.t1
MTLACQDAVAHGASCHAEETIVMQHALRNTTAVLHGLVAGNWTDIASLLSGAYSEVSSISSLLKGDSSQSSAAEALKDRAAYGGTLFVQLTYFLPRVLLDLLSSASCALGQFVVSPVWSVSFWAAVYLWLHGKWITAAVYLLLNVAVWWQVPTVIYAEIPEANAWLTGLGVVLGVGQFGLAGVVLGPLLASVPLICYNLVKLFNTLQWQQDGDDAASEEHNVYGSDAEETFPKREEEAKEIIAQEKDRLEGMAVRMRQRGHR